MSFSKFGRRIWARYENLLNKYPKYTKGLTGGVLAGVGDLFAQYLFESHEKLNYNRTCVMFSYGLLQTKLEVVYWYKFLDWVFGKQMSFRSSLLKTITDLLFFAPFEIGLCISWVNYFEDKPAKIMEKLKEEFQTILIASYMVWFPFGFLCFYAVPVHFRALYIGMVSLGWDMYISFASHNSVKNVG